MKLSVKFFMGCLTLFVALLLFSSCDNNTNNTNNGNCFSDLANWKITDSAANSSPFNCAWNKNNVFFNGCNLILFLNNVSFFGKQYSSGECKSKCFYSDGKFQVSIKPPKESGVVTGFFLFSDKSDSANHNEIDFEFVGKRTDSVQINYIFNGVKGKEKFIKLGFDASSDFHTYTIEWKSDSVIWYVDSKRIFSISQNEAPIPTTERMRVFFNLWCIDSSDAKYWAGEFKYPDVPINAYFKDIKMF